MLWVQFARERWKHFVVLLSVDSGWSRPKIRLEVSADTAKLLRESCWSEEFFGAATSPASYNRLVTFWPLSEPTEERSTLCFTAIFLVTFPWDNFTQDIALPLFGLQKCSERKWILGPFVVLRGVWMNMNWVVCRWMITQETKFCVACTPPW